MKNTFILLLLVISLQSYSQIDNLKSEYRDVSWINDIKTAEIVSTLSSLYGIDSLKSSKHYVNEIDYNLYYDSLTLYFLTSKKKYNNDNDTNALTTVTNFKYAKYHMTLNQSLSSYEYGTMKTYNENKQHTSTGTICVPSNWENLNIFYKEERKNIKEFNNGRIKSYSYSTSDTKGLIYFHKTIKPSDTDGYTYGFIDYFIPVAYFYTKPKVKVYKASIQKVWESKTGLPYSVAKQINLSDDRIPTILKMLGEPNNNLVNREQKIYVHCDTCIVKFYDNVEEDGDIIKYVYSNESNVINLTNKETNKQIIINESNLFTMTAISKGKVGLCTFTTWVDDKEYTFQLKKDENINIKLIKE